MTKEQLVATDGEPNPIGAQGVILETPSMPHPLQLNLVLLAHDAYNSGDTLAEDAETAARRRGNRQTQALAEWASRGDPTDTTYPW